MNTIETALSVSGLPVQAQACLAALSRGELGGFFNSPSGFFILYGGGTWTGSTASFPTWSGSEGPAGPTHAALFLQFEPSTYAECAANTGKADISPQSQILNGWWLVQHVAGADTLSLLEGGSLTTLAGRLIETWPAGADSNFPGFYASELAILQSGAPAPPPPPTPPPTNVTITLQGPLVLNGIDHNGNPATVTIEIASTAAGARPFVIPFLESDK